MTKEERKEYKRLYHLKNKDKINENSRQHYSENKDKQKEYSAQYRVNNKEKVKEYRRQYKNKAKENDRLYYLKNKDKIKEYRSNNRVKRNNRLTQRRATEPLYKLSCSVRRRIQKVINKKRVSKRTHEILGCSYRELKAHLESQFRDGMNWNNYGLKGWHIDHIIPLASGKTEEDVLVLCHYSNLQPLWALENLQKGAKINSGTVFVGI
jgi:hypothetical protein